MATSRSSVPPENNSPRWTRVNDVFQRAILLPEAKRRGFIAAECGDDAALRAEIESLVAAHEPQTMTGAASQLVPGTRIGDAEVTAFLAAGAMGEVYRAKDQARSRRRDEDPSSTSVGDRDRLARFQREAEVLASLNHSNIAAIYGLERSDGVTALVMELVEGPTLADRIAHGPIAIDEALSIAKQIAEALESAHEQGIVHRDLKPANIKVRDDGTVKVLDFGLAKAVEPTASTLNMSRSPTITSPAMLTGVGMLLGTAAYMAPEQARGKPVDKRADIWAFGCVLYEMLSGRRAFAGEDVTDTLTAVMRDTPDWSALPGTTPTGVRRLLARCLERDVHRRLRDIGDAFAELDEDVTALVAAPAGSQSMRWPVAAAVGVAVLAILGLLAWRWLLPSTEPVRTVRFAILPTDNEPIMLSSVGRSIALAPNGAFVVYGGDGELFIRPLDQLSPSRVVGVDSARVPFVSPDSQWIGYATPGGLRKIAASGGPALTITSAQGIDGAVWMQDDTIVFSGERGLWRVSAAGGEAKPIDVKFDPPLDGAGFHYGSPAAVPGRHAILFSVQPFVRQSDAGQIALLDLDSGRATVLVRGGSSPQTVGPYLLYGEASLDGRSARHVKTRDAWRSDSHDRIDRDARRHHGDRRVRRFAGWNHRLSHAGTRDIGRFAGIANACLGSPRWARNGYPCAGA